MESPPWQDQSELSMVRDWFYPSYTPEDPYDPKSMIDMRQEAVARVNVWTFKSARVPAAVVATADLTDSVIHYEKMLETDNSTAYRAVQFMFAFSFLRFVNSFVDKDVIKNTTASLTVNEDNDDEGTNGQLKGAGESSMYAHAALIGMPTRFVDLRHQVAHGEVPDIVVLNRATADALVWLWEKWWKHNATGDAAKALCRFEAHRQREQQLI